ncbi:MAG TPA: hypothetical protein VLM11_18480 [Streptosporangiaceae bacterium]|nr:hypothetical protein [Streptosporangiaceae bacterium]
MTVVGVAIRSFTVASWPVRVWSIVGGLALLAVAAVVCYAVVLFLLPAVKTR